MRMSRKTDFRKLKIILVTMTYHSQRPQCPSLSPHVLLLYGDKADDRLFTACTSIKLWLLEHTRTSHDYSVLTETLMIIIVNVTKVCFVIQYQHFLSVVCDIDFIVITGNILPSVNDIPIVKPGISLYRRSLYRGSAPYILL